MTITMPPDAVLYRLAKQAKDRAKREPQPSMSDHLNHIGNRYLVALTDAEMERK